MTDNMNLFNANETKAQFILSLVPFTLFFPIGVGYTVIALFLLALILGGHYRDRWQTIKDSPMFWPVMALLIVSCASGLLFGRPDGFWKAFLHYQIYLVLLLFISVGSGRWQQRALKVFFAGALVAATLFYLDHIGLLPDWTLVQNYIKYSGNKSILLGILLGIAGSWMLNEVCARHDHKSIRIAAFLYIAIAVLFFAKTRTGNLIFIVGCVLVLLRYVNFSWRGVLLIVGLAVVIGVAWRAAPDFRARMLGTVHDVRAFTEGGPVSNDGIRLELYRITTDIIKERPIAGHGIGAWFIEYQVKAKGLESQSMATPHNDYLLYAAEIGIIGLCALLWIWITQLVVAIRIGGETGVRLFTLGVAIMLGGMFNAILRDALFGVAFMVLLAIPLAGINRHSYRRHDHG